MNASAASANDWHISSDLRDEEQLALVVRSTITPAHADSRRIGPNWHADSTPTATPLPVRWSTSSVSATIVSQLPVLETVWPMKNSRKLRDRNDESVRPTKLGPGARRAVEVVFGRHRTSDALRQALDERRRGHELLELGPREIGRERPREQLGAGVAAVAQEPAARLW